MYPAAPARSTAAGELGHLLEGDQHDRGRRVGLGQPAGGLHPVHARHPHVDQDQVGPEVGGQLERLLAGARLADLLEARRGGDQAARRP